MKLGVRGVLGLAISAACLYFAFRNVQWNDAIEHARTANYWLLALAAACATGPSTSVTSITWAGATR